MKALGLIIILPQKMLLKYFNFMLLASSPSKVHLRRQLISQIRAAPYNDIIVNSVEDERFMRLALRHAQVRVFIL